MTNDNGELKACPETIYLQPECCADPEVGRLWCEDNNPSGEECENGKEWTAYVRADLTRPDSGDDGLNWNASDTEYDMSIHSNPDHYAWADFFLKTFPNCGADRDTMAGWFANAMMAKHDSITALSSNEQGRQRGNKNSDECDKCGRLYSVVYRVPNDLWSRIAPKPETLGPHIEHQGGGMLCPECAVEAARNLDIRLVFVAHVWTEDEPAKPKAEDGDILRTEAIQKLQMLKEKFGPIKEDDGACYIVDLAIKALSTRAAPSRDDGLIEAIKDCQRCLSDHFHKGYSMPFSVLNRIIATMDNAITTLSQAGGSGEVEPCAVEYQHEDTGQIGYVDMWQVEQGFFDNNPRLQRIGNVYSERSVASLKPAKPKAEDVPLIDEETMRDLKEMASCKDYLATRWIGTLNKVIKALGGGNE